MVWGVALGAGSVDPERQGSAAHRRTPHSSDTQLLIDTLGALTDCVCLNQTKRHDDSVYIPNNSV